MAGVKVLRVKISAPTTSFRYPRVQVGRLPTFDMPPPATIYGHLAGVVGEWFDPCDLEFAYTFQHAGKAIDLETIHPIERGSGKTSLKKQGWNFPVNVHCDPNVQRREFLVKPVLTLYLRSSDWGFLGRFQQAFLAPYFGYILGRSQDLATCEEPGLIDLENAAEAFYSHTLLPYDWRRWVIPGTTVLLPTTIDYARNRSATQERYLQVTRPILRLHEGSGDLTSRSELPATLLVDPSDVNASGERKLSRGVYFWPVRGPGGSA